MKKFLVLFIGFSLAACLPSKNEGLPPELLQEAVGALEKEAETPVEENTTDKEEPKTVINLETSQLSDDDQCQVLAKGLVEAFEDVNYCQQDDDCRIAPGVCPFGCYYLYNDALDFDSYARDIINYKGNCKPCEYKCENPDTLEPPKCVDNRCVLLQS